ncbi:MAG: T9SS type A sorting domain-containing protein [Bacteroidota bacterium]
MKNSNNVRFFFPMIITSLLVAVLSTATMAQPCSGPPVIFLFSQADVNNFQANYGPCSTPHDLNISGADITDLTPLSGLTSLSGTLTIQDCSILTSLDGLSGITSTNGLLIRRNPILADLDALSNLNTVNGKNLIIENTLATNVDFLSNITSAFRFGINRNSQLTNIDGVSGITTTWSCSIIENDILPNIDGLSNLTTFTGLDFWISGNPALENIDGLSGLTSLPNGRIIISDNASLTNLNGLSNLTDLNSGLFITENSALTNLQGLSSLTTIGSIVVINDNASLTSLNGLSNLSPVQQFGMNIRNNPQLNDLGALSSITNMRSLIISGNASLDNLDGLAALVGVEFDLTINDNPLLRECCSIESLINTPSAVGRDIFISNNQAPCDSPSEITIYCTPDYDMDGYTVADGDCDDNDANTNPGAPEICDGKDNNCNGQVDEGISVHNGNISFASQAQLDAWSPCISTINGSVTILGSNITDLSPLSNIQSVSGNFTLQSTGLSDLNGLQALQTVGGMALIYFNFNLTSLTGLHNLSSVSGNLSVYYNFSLTDCCAIHDLLDNEGVVGAVQIFLNGSGCNNQAEILNHCIPGQNMIGQYNGLATHPSFQENQGVQIFPNPAKELVDIQLNKGFKNGKLHIFNSQGRLVKQQALPPHSQQFQWRASELPTGLYIVKTEVDGEFFTTKLIVEE